MVLGPPPMFIPFLSKQLPWQGQFHCFSIGFHCTRQPRWGQMELSLVTFPASSLYTAILRTGSFWMIAPLSGSMSSMSGLEILGSTWPATLCSKQNLLAQNNGRDMRHVTLGIYLCYHCSHIRRREPCWVASFSLISRFSKWMVTWTVFLR